MDWATRFEALSTREKEEFRDVMNRLISETFLVKRKDSTRQAYYFAERHTELIQGYVAPLGWNLVIDRASGVCQLTGRQGGQRLSLNVIQSVLLLIFRLLYEQQRKQLTITEDVVVLTEEIQNQYLALKMSRRPLEKKPLRDGINLFKRYNLVEPLDGDVTAPECRIKVYPSILFAVRVDSLQALHERLVAYVSPQGADPAEEEDDADDSDAEVVAG